MVCYVEIPEGQVMPETTYVKINVVAPMNKGVVEVTSIRD